MTINKKLQVATVTSIGALIAMIITGWLFVDERYAHATDVQQMEQGVIQTIENLQIRLVTDELSRLETKESLTQLNSWEKVQKKNLERQFELLTK